MLLAYCSFGRWETIPPDILLLLSPLLTDLMANISLNNYRLPTEEDFDGAMMAIRRLQDTYKLQPSLIGSGKLKRSGGLPMSGEWASFTSERTQC